jgi:predicted MPP superfamily phosphohydrolase
MWFVAIFLSIYALMNVYVFLRVRWAFPQMGKLQVAAGAFLALMIVAPLAVRYLGRHGYERLDSTLSLGTFSWLAIVFWFFSMGIVVELWNLGTKLGGAYLPWASKLQLPPLFAFCLISAVVAMAFVAASFEAQDIRIETVRINTPKLPAGARPLLIAQISDMHLGGGTGKRRLRKVIELIKEAKPDILIATGDMIDQPYDALREEAAMLAEIKLPLPDRKFAIYGNHEHYVERDGATNEARKFHEAAGFHILVPDHSLAARPAASPMAAAPRITGGSFEFGVTMPGTSPNTLSGDGAITIIGLDDPGYQPLGHSPDGKEQSLLALARQGSFIILLKHRPDVEDDSLGKFDLQMSGHTHGGQIFPFSAVTGLIYKYGRGLYELPNGSKLYTNRGAGTWGPPLRLGARPEVTIFEIQGTK